MDNIRALCPMCHAEETDTRLNAGVLPKYHTIESHLSPKLWRELHNAPKPKEVSFGLLEESHYHIQDLLSGHPKPERPCPKPAKKPDRVMCLDAVRCRSNALTQRRALPIFCPLDEPEPYYDADWDFVYIDMECRVHRGLFPYTGSRWYAAEVARYLLDTGMSVECCKAGLRATRHIPGAELAAHIETLASIAPSDKFMKQGILSAIGLWNATSQCIYRKIQSEYQIDAGPGVRSRRQLPDGGFEWTACEEVVDLYSMAPWGRIALDVEQLRVAQAIDLLKNCKVLGAHVDGVFFEGPRISIPLFPDGSPMFQLKEEPVCKLPTWEQSNIECSQKLSFEPRVWTVMEKELKDYWEIAEIVRDRQGLMITGYAGTGKTWPLKYIRPILAELLPGKQLVMALRHAAAMIAGGKTIQHYLCKYRTKPIAPGTIVIIDEFSEVQLHTWAELARWKLAGAIFILVGDADGQRTPMFDRWQDAMTQKDIRQSQFLWELAGGVRVQMTTNRRGDDPVLFRRYCELYPHADDETYKAHVIKQGLRNYPAYETGPVCYFVLSHSKRIQINAMINKPGPDRLHLPKPESQYGVTMEGQDMDVCVGQELLCCRRRYEKDSCVSGARYIVESWDSKTITVKLYKDYGDLCHTLTHKRAAEMLRLQHALCYASIQGRTFTNTHVVLLDLENPHVTMRDIITAMSRPTNGRYLHFGAELV
jgi:hypothetical protein